MNKLFWLYFLACMLLSSGYATAAGLRDFTSDGCTLFPDGTHEDRTQWCDCCFTHDVAYWRGGTSDEKERADVALRECVIARTGNKALANVMYEGVRLGGSPAFPSWYRWAYGWPYGRQYKPLAKQEEQEVALKFEAYKSAHPFGYCRKRMP